MFAIPKHHVIVKQTIPGILNLVVPALYLEIEGKPHLVKSLIKFFVAYPMRSHEWRRKHSRALGLFYDYLKVNYQKKQQTLNHTEIIRKFALSHLNGTISNKTGYDELELNWPASSIQQTKQTIQCLMKYITWCKGEGIISYGFNKNNPTQDELSYLKYVEIATKIKDFTFLGYTRNTVDIAKKIAQLNSHAIITLGNSTNQTNNKAKKFPSDLIEPLLKYGFIIDENADDIVRREDITAKMITILLLFTGTRVSEPMHLWFNDVIPQPDGTCRVILRHPRDAYTNIPGEKKLTRSQYLSQYGLLPRDTDGQPTSYYAGWKNIALESDLSAACYFFYQDAERLFRELYIKYLRYRADLIDLYKSRTSRIHPFLFVNRHKELAGAPYSIHAYRAALERAYKRIEKKMGITIKRGKYSGTTPHGMRHFFGQTLTDAGIEQKVIQKALHHRSILSQTVYTEPSETLIRNTLDEAALKLDRKLNIL